MAIRKRKPSKRVKRTRNLGTETEAAFFGKLRSDLRKRHVFWKPAKAALKAASICPKTFKCACCGKAFPKRIHVVVKSGKKKGKIEIKSNAERDHKVPCGSLNCFADLSGFAERMFCESPEGYQILSKECHLRKTNDDKLRQKCFRIARESALEGVGPLGINDEDELYLKGDVS